MVERGKSGRSRDKLVVAATMLEVSIDYICTTSPTSRRRPFGFVLG